MPSPSRSAAPPITPQLAVRVAVLGGLALRAVRDRVLPPVVPAGALGRGLLSPGAREPRAQGADRGAARRHRRPQRHVLVKTRVAPVVQIVPSSLPESVLEQADEFRKQRSVAETERLAAAAQLRALERDIRERRRGASRQQRRERRRLARAARRATRSGPGAAGRRDRAAAPVSPARPRDQRQPAADPRARDRGHRRAAVLERDDQVGGQPRGVQLHPRAQGGVPRRRGREAVPARLPARRARRPAVRDHARDLAGRAQAEALQGVEPGTRIGADGIEESYDKVPARQATASRGRDQRARQARRPAADEARRAAPGPAAARSRSTSSSSAPPTTRSGAASRRRRRTAPRRARSWRWTRATARSSRSAPTRASTPTSSPSRSRRSATTSSTSEAIGAPLFNRAIAATYPTGSTFKPITAMAALEEGVITPATTIVDDGKFELGDQVRKNAKDAVVRRAPAAARADGVLGRLLLRAGRAAQRARGRSCRSGPSRLGLGRRTGIDIPGEFAGLIRTASGATRATTSTRSARRRRRSPQGTTAALYECGGIERPWTTRRQRQPRGRPGRPAGDAAPARRGVLDDRQRRQGRPPAPRPAGRGRQRPARGGDPDADPPPRATSTRPTATRS